MNETKTLTAENNKKQTLKRILAYIRPYSPLVICFLLLAVVSVVLQLLIPILIGEGVDQMVGRGSVNTEALLQILTKILICIGATAAAQWLMNHMNNVITYRVVRDLRTRAFNHVHVLPLSYLDVNSSGDTLSRLITDVEQFSDGLLLGFTQLFTGVITIVGTIVFMLTLQPVVTVIVVLFTPLSFKVAKLISGRSYRYFKNQSEARGKVTDLTNEMLGNLKIVQSFGREQAVMEEFEKRNRVLGENSLKATFISSLTNPSTRFVNTLIYNGVVFAGCLLCFLTPFGMQAMSIGKLTSFLSYVKQYSQPFNDITAVITEFQNSLASASRVFEILDETPETPDDADAITVDHAEGRVNLSDVSFSYLPDKPLIEHLNVDVTAGKRIAIVGPTGCGKTTLINLLMRFYDVNEGSIAVDGTDIRHYRRSSLRSNFGMVLQDTWLKAGTVRENIAYGHPEASMDEVQAAAKKAHADGFIRRMPHGYDTVIEENGGNLSAGQKQLLCIARVMLSLPPILILDEATSSIDTRTEHYIQRAFDEMMKGRTSFVVAHRLSTIRDADEILVMKDGHIIEQGDHETLLAKKGFYSRLYHAQFEKTAS
uniref:ABC-type multidrug transport system, ATPase and permease component n=1 Tax=Eubacterium cellulosolvens (strain ATCC 43171 / JCM 9499 / 6) TaxID=633697 RepID=I5AQZ2_EUBC6